MTRLKTSRSPLATVPCRAACGEQVRIVRLLSDLPVRGEATWVPIVPGYPTYHGNVPPSHALSAGRTTARVLRHGETPDPTEHPALIHHAICAALRPAPARDFYDPDDYEEDGDW